MWSACANQVMSEYELLRSYYPKQQDFRCCVAIRTAGITVAELYELSFIQKKNMLETFLIDFGEY